MSFREDRKIGVQEFLHAKPLESEPDRAEIKWPKIKRIKVKRKKIITRRRFHPGTKEARKALRIAGRDLTTCEACGSRYKIAIHHIDRNPFNNEVQNLRILCERCHREEHKVEDAEVIEEFSTIPFEDEDVIVEEIELEKNSLSLSLSLDENELEKAPKGAIIIINNNNTLEREKERDNFSKKAYPKHISMLLGLRENVYECRHCDFYRAFKHRCDLLDKQTNEHDPICNLFKPR